MKRGERHSPDARARIAASVRATMASPVVRERISTGVRMAMASPIVRERIRKGMRAGNGTATEMAQLQASWNGARASVRKEFLAAILAPFSAVRRRDD